MRLHEQTIKGEPSEAPFDPSEIVEAKLDEEKPSFANSFQSKSRTFENNKFLLFLLPEFKITQGSYILQVRENMKKSGNLKIDAKSQGN